MKDKNGKKVKIGTVLTNSITRSEIECVRFLRGFAVFKYVLDNTYFTMSDKDLKNSQWVVK